MVEFFVFELVNRLEILENSSFSFTIGAVFRLKAATRQSTFDPAMVIAVPGALDHQDWGVNVDTLMSHGPQRHCFRIVMGQAGALAVYHGKDSNLWLCGHSLGAAVATLVGEQMTMKGGIAGQLVGGINAGKVGHVAGDMAVHAESIHDKDKEKQWQMQCFDNLNKSDPRVYVNPKDWLCKRYIKYFGIKMKGSP
ncbi:uncharacterized protein LOC116260188 [Nymphaea colorata]|uniref:uncharacterized protein LOC116260188 n=1 Tax=Nymphaea colorata TaxID=210225 RepID=UPI00129D25E9|nr:uncharacterized protein LOC116260188 [Nymphaea colorata]